MYDLNATDPMPTDFAVRTAFNKVVVPLYELVTGAEKAGLRIDGRRFVDCVIHGPCVIIPNADTRFENCNLGDVAGDVRNLFLRPAGPMITGGLQVNNCVFDGCIFIGVGFTGDDRFIEQFIASLDGRGV